MILALVMLSCVVEPEKSATDPVGEQPVDSGQTGDSGRRETGETGSPDTGDSGAAGSGGASGRDTAVDDDSGDTGTSDTATADTGIEPEPELVPDFTLEDLNPTSVRYAEMVSPRDYLEQVSGWYFIHAT